MKRIACYLAFVALTLLPALGPGGQTPSKPLAAAALEGKRWDYRIVPVNPAEKDSTRRLLRVKEFSFRVEAADFEGQPALRLTREEKSKEGDRMLWQLLMRPQNLGLFEVEKKTISRKGNLLEETRQFYPNDLFKYGDNMFHFHAFPIAFALMDLAPGKLIQFKLVFSPEMEPWLVNLTVESKETVTVPAGSFNCFRIRMQISAENLGERRGLASYLLKMFLPDYFVWVDQNPPHTLIRYQGRFGGFTSPEEIQELVKIQRL